MAHLQDILSRVNIRSGHGSTAVEVNDLQIDSRKITKGSAFIAIKGTASDGHQFIDTAVNKGASVIVCETMPENKAQNVIYVQVEDTGMAAGIMAHNFYGKP